MTKPKTSPCRDDEQVADRHGARQIVEKINQRQIELQQGSQHAAKERYCRGPQHEQRHRHGQAEYLGNTMRMLREMPMVDSASISSVTRITPICAVIADPERPPPARQRGPGRVRE
jgi:hypothetical protein